MCSAPGITAGASRFEGGASAAHWSRQLTWKKTEPRNCTLRSTSDSGSRVVVICLEDKPQQRADRRTREQTGATAGEVRRAASANHPRTDTDSPC
jgi:hypothetical protein